MHHYISWRNTSQPTVKSFSGIVGEPLCCTSQLLLWVQILLKLLEWRVEHELQEENSSLSILAELAQGWLRSLCGLSSHAEDTQLISLQRAGLLSFGLNSPLHCSLCRSSLDWR